MKIKTRQSGRTIKTFDRADNLAQKTKNGIAETNRTAEQLQDQSAESGVDYAGSRIQEGEEKTEKEHQRSLFAPDQLGCQKLRGGEDRFHRAKRRGA